MTDFGTTDTSTTPLGTNQFPNSSAFVPGDTKLTVIQGGPKGTDVNGKTYTPVAEYVPDGNNVAQGSTTDADTVSTVMGRLTKLRNIFVDVWDSVNHRIKVDGSGVTQPVSGSVSVSNFPATQPVSAASLPLPAGAAQEAGHLASIDTHIPALGQALAGASVPVVLTAAQQTALTPPAAIAGFALEAGHLATIDTSTAASKTDLDTILTNTNAFKDTQATGTVTNANDVVSIALPGGQATVLANILMGTLIGTLLFEASPDSGTTWVGVQGSQAGSSSVATSTAAAGAWRIGVAGFTNFRVRLNPVTSGTSGTITLRVTQGVHNVAVVNASALGQNVMSQSAPVVIASDQSAVKTKADFAEQAALTAGALNADLVASVDVSAYKWLSLELTNNVYAGTLSFQWSNDNALFLPLILYRIDTISGTTATSTTSGVGQGWCGPISFRYLRVRMTSWTSGAANGTLELYTAAPPYIFNVISAVQSGSWSLSATTINGSTPFHLVSLATTNATSVKATAGNVYEYNFSNTNAAARYIKFYNKASAPTVGTDVPVKTIQVPASGNASGSFPVGTSFAAGIAFATTVNLADTDTTVVGAGDLSIDFGWK